MQGASERAGEGGKKRPEGSSSRSGDPTKPTNGAKNAGASEGNFDASGVLYLRRGKWHFGGGNPSDKGRRDGKHEGLSVDAHMRGHT